MGTWRVCEVFRAGLRIRAHPGLGSFQLSLDQSRKASRKKSPGFLDNIANSVLAKSSVGRGRMVQQPFLSLLGEQVPAPMRHEQAAALACSSQPQPRVPARPLYGQ